MGDGREWIERCVAAVIDVLFGSLAAVYRENATKQYDDNNSLI